VAPNDTAEGYFTIERPVNEWIAIAEAIENRQTGNEDVFEITHWGPRDAEAIEHIIVRTGGTLLERVPDAPANWHLRQPVTLNSEVEPTYRTYYQSRSKNQMFPDN
jgi:hypothetical protein